MKKIFKRQTASSRPSRITNETVAEHREKILAGGRKFKYPVQYVRHRLVINAIIVAVLALIALSVFIWFQLYKVQNSGDFIYRVTRVLPLPVASVDSELVRYSDYLMYYRSSEYYLRQYEQVKPDTQDGKAKLEYSKRETMNNVIADTYAAKLARKNNVSVSDKEVDEVRERDLSMQNGKISQETRDASTRTVLNWSPEEYRTEIKRRLLMQKVSYLIDDIASRKKAKAEELVKVQNASFADIAKQLADQNSKVEYGQSGLVTISEMLTSPGAEAARLEKGAISGAIKGSAGDGYYFIRVLEKTTNQVNYEFIRIPLTQLRAEIANLRSAGKVKEFIDIPTVKQN